MTEGLRFTAEQIARKAHSGQFRRDGVTPYVKHLEAVVEKLKTDTDEVVATAWLHDVLEDTAVTEEELRAAGIPDSVIAVVVLLTHKDTGSYQKYLARVKKDEIARKVKLADMIHNLSDRPTLGQAIKYARGISYLLK